METDESALFVYDTNTKNTADGVPMGVLIDDMMLYDAPVWRTFYDKILSSDRVEDVSSEYPDWVGITLRYYKSSDITVEYQTTERTGSILLSNPKIIDLEDYTNGARVISPAQLVDSAFVQMPLYE